MTFGYSRWKAHYRYATSVLVMSFGIGLLCVITHSWAPVVLGIAVVSVAYSWCWRTLNVPIGLRVSPSELTFAFRAAAPEEVWLPCDVRFVDIRAGDLSRPLTRVVTFARNDGRIVIADGEVAAGERALVAALKEASLDVKYDREDKQDPTDIGDALLRRLRRRPR